MGDGLGKVRYRARRRKCTDMPAKKILAGNYTSRVTLQPQVCDTLDMLGLGKHVHGPNPLEAVPAVDEPPGVVGERRRVA